MATTLSVGLQGSGIWIVPLILDPDRFDLVVGGRRPLFSYSKLWFLILGSLSAYDSLLGSVGFHSGLLLII